MMSGNSQLAAKGLGNLAYCGKLRFPALCEGFIEACSGYTCLFGYLGHAHGACSSIQGVDKLFRAALFCCILEKISDIFLCFQVFCRVKWSCFQWHGLFLQLFQQLFCFADILLLGGFIPSGKEKDNLTFSNGVIHTVSGAKEHAQLRKAGCYGLAVTKGANGQLVDPADNPGACSAVFNPVKPLVVLFCASQCVSHGDIVSSWIQIVKGEGACESETSSKLRKNESVTPYNNEQKTKDIEKISECAWFSVVGCRFAGGGAPCCAVPYSCLQGVVNPLTYGEQHSAKRNDLDGCIAYVLKGNGEREDEHGCGDDEHSLVPIVNDELRKRVGCHFGLLLVMIGGVWGYTPSYLEQAIFSKNLTNESTSGYDTRVAAKSAAGFESPKSTVDTATASFGGFFVSAAWCAFGRLCGELRARRFRRSGLSTRIVAHFAFESVEGRNISSFYGGAPCTK